MLRKWYVRVWKERNNRCKSNLKFVKCASIARYFGITTGLWTVVSKIHVKQNASFEVIWIGLRVFFVVNWIIGLLFPKQVSSTDLKVLTLVP